MQKLLDWASFYWFLCGTGRANDFYIGLIGTGPKTFGPSRPQRRMKSTLGSARKKEVWPGPTLQKKGSGPYRPVIKTLSGYPSLYNDALLLESAKRKNTPWRNYNDMKGIRKIHSQRKLFSILNEFVPANGNNVVSYVVSVSFLMLLWGAVE